MDLEIDPALLGLPPPPGTGQHERFRQDMQQLSAVPAGGSQVNYIPGQPVWPGRDPAVSRQQWEKVYTERNIIVTSWCWLCSHSTTSHPGASGCTKPTL